MEDNLKWMEYAVFYPCEGEEGYDGVHDGDVKGIRDDAPPEIVKVYEKYLADEKSRRARGIFV